MNQGGIPSTFPLSTLADPHAERRLPRMTFVHYMDPEQASFSDLYKSKRASRGLRGYRGYSVPLEADWKGGGKVHGKVKT